MILLLEGIVRAAVIAWWCSWLKNTATTSVCVPNVVAVCL